MGPTAFRRFLGTLTVVASLLILGQPALAEAETEPVSDRVLSGQFTLPDGQLVQFKVVEGQLLKVYDIAGKSYGLAPYLLDDEGSTVRIELFELTERGSELESLSFLREFDIKKETPAGILDSIPGFLVEVSKVYGGDSPSMLNRKTLDTGLADTETVSDRIVIGELTLPEGQVLGFRVVEGQMFKVQDLGGRYHYGLSPYVVREGRVQFNVFEISERAPGLETVRFLERVEVREGIGSGAGPKSGIQVELSGFSSADVTGSQLVFRTSSSGPIQKAKAKRCCVTCDGVTACACAVEHSCGSCCVKGLCCEEKEP